MAERGYVTLAFDASHQGESGGYPRDTENPAERMEDIRCAIDYLTTLPIVDEDRVGLLGVCAGGSYVMAVAPTEMRAKAIASVSLWDLRVTAREGVAGATVRQNQRAGGNRKATHCGGAWSYGQTGRRHPEKGSGRRTRDHKGIL